MYPKQQAGQIVQLLNKFLASKDALEVYASHLLANFIGVTLANEKEYFTDVALAS